MASEFTPAALKDLSAIPNTWTRARLGDVATIFDCPHSTPRLASVGPYLVRTQDIRTGVLRIESVARVSEETYADRVRRAVPEFGDLLYSREGTYFGVAAEVPPGVRLCLGQRMVQLRPDKRVLNHFFLKYWLNSPSMGLHISGLRDGSVAERLNMSTIRSLPVAFPTLAVQNWVANTLCALDNRIELLRQANVTLESIAGAVFKSWFVDFDPVRAKADGLTPVGIGAEVVALFPSEFEDSELGSIPRGWRIGTVGDIAEFVKGCSYKGAGLSESSGAYMFNLGCFNAKRVFATENIKRYTGEYRERHSVSEGDLIIANTDMTQSREILGRPLLVPGQSAPGFVSHHVFKVQIKDAGAQLQEGLRLYLFFLFKQPEFRERAVGYATGTTVLALPRDSAEHCPMVHPSEQLLYLFLSSVGPLLDQIQVNEQRCTTLADLRDTLLPRLMSGKLGLPEAASLIEEAVA